MERFDRKTGNLIEFVKVMEDNIPDMNARLEKGPFRIYKTEQEYSESNGPLKWGPIDFPAFGKKGSLVSLWKSPYLGFLKDGTAKAWNENMIKEYTAPYNLLNRMRYGN